MMKRSSLGLALALSMLLLPAARAADADEFKIKREEVFEFAQKPAVTRQDDRVTITFESKGLCDATVAVEDAQGRIIRHLACGVLGPRAPAPLQRDAKKQTLVWDGKDDAGAYVDDKHGCVVRVSLGLKPAFERNLFFFPQRRNSRFPPVMAAQPEGVYVYDGGLSADHVRVYSHAGAYLRTVYPFPADKIGQVQGIPWHVLAHDGRTFPVKGNFTQMSFLTSGDNAVGVTTYKPELKRYESAPVGTMAHYGQQGAAASTMAVGQGRVALASILLNRLATDGSTGGLALTGPRTCLLTKGNGILNRGEEMNVVPRSAALAPDGKTLYLSGYVFARAIGHAAADIITCAGWDVFPVVMKLDITRDDPMQVFAGSAQTKECGNGPKQLNAPTCVTTDPQGRVYVADYLNNRVQVFNPAGELVKSIPAARPAWVRVHQKSGEIYVFSWTVATADADASDEPGPAEKPSRRSLPPTTLTVLGPLPETKQVAAYNLPGRGDVMPQLRYGTTFYQYFAELDSWADKPTFWLVQDWAQMNVLTAARPMESNISIYQLDGGKIVPVLDFEKEIAGAKVRPIVQRSQRQRLYANPKTGRVFLTEGDAFIGKSFKDAWEIDPATGAIRYVQLPFDAEDMCFDRDGLAYLRSINVVVRYDPASSWREVPWDYGEERKAVHTSDCGDRRAGPALSGLPLPANGGWHHGGMWISPRGHLVVACGYNPEGGALGKLLAARKKNELPAASQGLNQAATGGGQEFDLTIYPGRGLAGRGGPTILHIWDREGHIVQEDLLPGLCDTPLGIAIDNDDGVTLLASPTRVLDGQRYYNDLSGTVIKVLPRKARIVSEGGPSIPVPLDKRPGRPPDFTSGIQGDAWINGAEWLYGGAGWFGKNRGIGCGCFNARMTYDYFNRTFAPLMDQYSVAVLDGSGNLILRVGRYGNVDDGIPMRSSERGMRNEEKTTATPGASSDSALDNPRSALRTPRPPDGPMPVPPQPRAMGGDEVALMHGAYLAAHTDRRLFIADAGNARIISVKLDYHANERVELKDVADEGQK
jgi:hypothetical protein